MTTSYVMKISRNGQVSIPANTRSRWDSDRVVVVDLGDRIVLRPLPALLGKYRTSGPDTDSLRRIERDEAAAQEEQRA